MMHPASPIITGALCYALHGRRVLLIQRSREPHLGKWTAPGGKMEMGESPQDCVIREMFEETGLRLVNPQLCGIVTSIDRAWPIHWLLFIFRAEVESDVIITTHEGELRWIPLDQLGDYPKPYSDEQYLSRVLAGEGLFHARFIYETPERCIEAVFY